MTLKNETGRTIYVKPESAETGVELKNGETYPSAVDGYYDPSKPNEIIKIFGKEWLEPFDYVALPAGPVIVSADGKHPPEPSTLQKVLEVVTFSGKLDKQKHLDAHPDWKPMVDAAPKTSAENTGGGGGSSSFGENEPGANGRGFGEDWDGSVLDGGGKIFGPGGVSIVGGFHDDGPARLEAPDDESRWA